VCGNSASDAIDSNFPTNVMVSHNGVVLWVPVRYYTSACRIEIRWFPFDDQICVLKFGSWTYTGNKINLTSKEDSIDTSTYLSNGEWDLVGTLDLKPITAYFLCHNDELQRHA
jgi:nicotinic acetylcholine receptor, invertebrate